MNSNLMSRRLRLAVLVVFVLASFLLAKGEASAIGGSFGWAKNIGGMQEEDVQSITVDAAGNNYMTGAYSGTVDFDPGPGIANLTSAGSADIFVTKLDNSGNFIWARSMGNAFYYEEGTGVGVDAAGSVYTTGHFRGTTDFDPGPGVFNLTSAGPPEPDLLPSYDIFISKLDSNGNFVWAKRIGGLQDEESLDFIVDPSGNVYTTGAFEGNVDFDPGIGVAFLTSAGGLDGDDDIFISKLDSNGNYAWARSVGGVDNDRSFGIAVDANGNVYTTGTFEGTADFDPGPGTVNLTTTGFSFFLSKLDSSGGFAWVHHMSGIGGENEIDDIAVDPAGNVYTTGSFAGTVDLDPGPETFNLTSQGGVAIFFSKLDSNGSFLWARSTAGDSAFVEYLALDTGGNLYTAGDLNCTMDFDPGPGTANLTSAGEWDTFIAKLDSNGNYAWARQLDGHGNSVGAFSSIAGIAVDPSGSVYLANEFKGTMDFDPGPGTHNLTSTGVSDIFLLKLQEAAIFGDLPPGYWALDFIERLYAAGITGGCVLSPLQYCPEQAVTRAQMAVFLLRGIHTSSYTPPPVGGSTGFGDVPVDYWAAAFIKQLAAAAITSGCGGGNYCPEQPVTRAQMAVFLLKAKHGAGYVPPAVGAGTDFGDVPTDYWAAAFIKQLVTEGITAGCGSGNYCPEQPVTRAQMAVFLVRTFSLP